MRMDINMCNMLTYMSLRVNAENEKTKRNVFSLTKP